MGTGSDRGDDQPDDRDVIPKLQVFVYNLDVGEG